MKRVILLEHGRLYRARVDGSAPGGSSGNVISPALFDRLHRFDVSRPEQDRIFSWHRDHARASQWVGVIQLPGLLLEVLPKIDGHPAGSKAAPQSQAETRVT